MLEDMLQAFVLDFKGSWDKHLPLVELAYYNSYYSNFQLYLLKHYMAVAVDHPFAM